MGFLAKIYNVSGSNVINKKTWCWSVGGNDLTGALHDL